MVGRLVRGLGFHLLVVLVRNVLGDDLIGGGLLLLPKRRNLAVYGGRLSGELLYGALVSE